MPKFVTVKFKPEDAKEYTYLLGGLACEIGDEIIVPMGKGDGEKRVIVSGFSDSDPPYACKAVIGLAPPREEKPASEVDKLIASGAVETVEMILDRGIGDNSGNMTPLETHTVNISDIYGDAKLWLDGTKVENQAQADDVTRLLDMARNASKAADAQRKVEAKPFDDGKKKVQADWTPLIAKADKVESAAKATIADWLRREGERQRKEAADARAIADKAAATALQESRAAATSGDLGALEAAEALLKEAKSANREATRGEAARPTEKVEGMARAVSLRTVWDVALADAVEGETSASTLLARWAFSRDPQRCLDLFMQMAREEVRSGVRSIPGTVISSRETL